jgi:hypothetical protein
MDLVPCREHFATGLVTLTDSQVELMLSLYSRQGASKPTQRRQLWLKSVNLVFWPLPGLATRYHQKARDIIIIGGHGLGAFIRPSKNTAMKLDMIKGRRALLFWSLKGSKPCLFQLNHAKRTDPQTRPRVAMLAEGSH